MLGSTTVKTTDRDREFSRSEYSLRNGRLHLLFCFVLLHILLIVSYHSNTNILSSEKEAVVTSLFDINEENEIPLHNQTENYTERTLMGTGDNGTQNGSGIAACMWLLDDTIMLHEWIAYHYTTLPLSTLVIGLDPKTSNESIADIKLTIQNWNDTVGLPIQIWQFPKPEELPFTTKIVAEHAKRQAYFTWICTHRFKKEGKEKWLLLTDSDEFLAYNYIHKGEDSSYFGPFIGTSRMALTKEHVIEYREKALPIRKKLPGYKHKTILTFLQDQVVESEPYFQNWRKRTCIRLAGMTFGNEVADINKHELLMTRRYRNHQKRSDGRSSKVLLQLTGWQRKKLRIFATIHNPFPLICGDNGATTSGQDHMSAVLKYSHYIGSLESWMERGGFRGDNKGLRNNHTMEMKNIKNGPYEEELDDSMSYWFGDFLRKFGKETTEKLLLRPIQNKINTVRTIHNLTAYPNKVL